MERVVPQNWVAISPSAFWKRTVLISQRTTYIAKSLRRTDGTEWEDQLLLCSYPWLIGLPHILRFSTQIQQIPLSMFPRLALAVLSPPLPSTLWRYHRAIPVNWVAPPNEQCHATPPQHNAAKTHDTTTSHRYDTVTPQHDAAHV